MIQYPDNITAQLLMAQCVANDIQHVVISPGSRNAPLIVGFCSHPGIKTYSIVDERCAAFFALGIAQQQRAPVALLCTSGSALVNYYPAISEAFYARTPLLVISADRPKKYLDIGEGQTIRQEGIFKNHIGFEANVQESESPEITSEKIAKAILVASEYDLPVHINIPFDEPFYNFTSDLIEISKTKKKSKHTAINLDEYVLKWNTFSKKMILVGQHFPNQQLESVIKVLSQDPSVLVVVEHTANMHDSKFLYGIDNRLFPLNENDAANFKIDILITLGNFVVSKNIKAHFRKNPPKHHWHVDETRALDTFLCLEKHIKKSSLNFFKELLQRLQRVPSHFQTIWLKKAAERQKKHDEFLSSTSFSDLKVMGQLLHKIPKNTQLHLSNSSIIRYAQLFQIDESIQIFCNRGTSGIDGCTSTAIGASVANQKPTVLITGDLGFFYDSNALWNNYIPKNFRIIVVNNGGGGIFRFIKGPRNTSAMDYFETPHQLSCKPICDLHQFEYFQAIDKNSLSLALSSFFELSDSPKLLEVKTPREQNDMIFKEYMNFIKS